VRSPRKTAAGAAPAADGAALPGRREFLAKLGTGCALVTLPPFIAGCGVVPATEAAAPAPANPFLDWFGLDERRLSRTLSTLGQNGGDFGEIYLQHARRTHLVLEDGEFFPATADIEQGAGLRVVRGESVGFAHTEDLTTEGLERTAREAARGGAAAGLDLPALAASPAGGLYVVETHWSDVATAEKRAIIESLDRAARNSNPAVSRVRIEWRDSDERIVIATLDGRLITDRRPLTSLSVEIGITRDGVTHTAFASTSAREGPAWYDAERLDRLAADAAGRALLRFEARRPPEGELPVILAAGAGGILLHEAVGHALEGDLLASGASHYAGRSGQRAGSEAVTLVDDATLAHRRGSLNVDDEGSRTNRNVLIENGILRSGLHDRLSARRTGSTTTGSARRESFRHPPLPRMTCTLIEDGAADPVELVDSVALGILAETFAPGRLDPASGDFRFPVTDGWLIENGRRTLPIRDTSISGKASALLGNVTAVANDGRLHGGGWTCGKAGQRVPVSVGMPSVLVAGLAVGDPA